jgi:pinin
LPPAKRRESSGPSGRFNRSGREGGSSSEEEEEKPSLLSVVAGGKRTVSRTSRSQSDLVEKAGEKSNRNKRMLGVLMGTLNRFKVDQQRESQLGKDKKRIEIENRVEDERLAVREEMAAQRKELFTQRKSQKREVMELERKMHIVESFKEWEEHYGHLANYIKTKAKPPIYYKPKTHNKSTQELLEKHAQECKGAHTFVYIQ